MTFEIKSLPGYVLVLQSSLRGHLWCLLLITIIITITKNPLPAC